MSVKYGQYSQFHLEILSKCKLSDEGLAMFLIANTLFTDDFEFERKKVDNELRKLKIDQKEFKIKVYKP